jgi:PAS domain S-box-containing protein
MNCLAKLYRFGSAARVASAYAVFGVVWIFGSDRLLEALIVDPHRMTLVQTYKGWAFVFASTVLLYIAVCREWLRRERAESALRASETLHGALAESAQDPVFIVGRGERIEYLNPAAAHYFGKSVDEIRGRNLRDVLPGHVYARHARNIEKVFSSGQPVSFEGSVSTADGVLRWFDTLLTPIEGTEGGAEAVLGVAREITQRKRAEAQVAQQVQRAGALRNIDRAITASLDLPFTLDVVLTHVTAALGVDAASILLLGAHSPTLEYAAGTGFRTRAVTRSSLRLGEGYAGRAALERKVVSLKDVSEIKGPVIPFSLLEKESFVAYYGVPLVAKGQVKGVLEIFHRSPLDPDPEWLQFLDTVATDAAIAIDNAVLFEDLQRLNRELVIAYDATLEGWGRALELRDEETEGHTERVTELTLRLARAMGVSETDLVHIRRGSFLHDIGKIGIPDRVLFNTEALTEEEREVMRLHPVYAFRILQPIRFLRPALDIPYCHHEHWDGSGYPRGLKGEQIPLAARIFSVVDVWDALTSNRRYHPGWSKEEAREHVRAGAGTQFDPAAVEAFLRLVG